MTTYAPVACPHCKAPKIVGLLVGWAYPPFEQWCWRCKRRCVIGKDSNDKVHFLSVDKPLRLGNNRSNRIPA